MIELFQKLVDVLYRRAGTRRDTAFSLAVDDGRVVALHFRHRKDNGFRAFYLFLVDVALVDFELLADYARRRGNCVIVKGLRAVSDFESEFQMALINRKINPSLDTMFLTADSQYMFLSSSVIKELGTYGVELSDFLPSEIISDFQARIKERNQFKEENENE